MNPTSKQNWGILVYQLNCTLEVKINKTKKQELFHSKNFTLKILNARQSLVERHIHIGICKVWWIWWIHLTSLLFPKERLSENACLIEYIMIERFWTWLVNLASWQLWQEFNWSLSEQPMSIIVHPHPHTHKQEVLVWKLLVLGISLQSQGSLHSAILPLSVV